MVTTRKRPGEPEAGAVERGVDAFEHALIHRWPHITGPPALAGAAWGLAWAAHHWPGWPQWAVTIAVVVTVVLGVESIRHLPGPRERGYAWVCWLGGGGWVITAAWLGPGGGSTTLGVPALTVLWALLIILLWPPWFRHRRIRRAVDVSREIGAWDGDAVGLPGVDLVDSGAGADTHSWWARLKPQVKGSYTLHDLRKRIPNIAARYGRRISDVSVEALVDEHEGEYLLRMQTSDPGADRIVQYRPPDTRPTLREPFQLGVRPNGTPLWAELWRDGHGGVDGLTAGQKGYGKSVLFERIALQAIAAHDALVIVCDLKPGSPDFRHTGIGPRGAYIYATTPEQIDLVIRVLRVLCAARGARPRPDRKVLVVLMDETFLYYATTVPETVPPGIDDPAERGRAERAARRAARDADEARQSNMDQLVAVSRSSDIALHEAAQRGEQKRMGGAAIRSALLSGQVVGFYSPRAADSGLLSNDGEFDLSALPVGVPGEVQLANGRHPEVTRGRLWNVTEEAITATLDRFADDQGDLEDDELKALGDEFGLAWAQLRAANREKPPPAPRQIRREELAVPAGRMSREQSLQVVWDALAACPKPALTREVAAAVGKSEEMVRVRLNELVEQGRAVKEGHARWIKYSAVRR